MICAQLLNVTRRMLDMIAPNHLLYLANRNAGIKLAPPYVNEV